MQLGPEQGRQRGVAIREPDRHPAGGEARQRPGAPHRVFMERGHVFEMVAVQQSLAVGGRHGAARMDAGRQQGRRAERGDVGFDIAHPADRVVEGRVEGGDRECRRIAEQHDRSPDARRLVGAVGQHHVGRRSSGRVADPRRGREDLPGAGSQGRDGDPERRSGPSGAIAANRRRPAAALSEPPARRRAEPAKESPERARPAHMRRFGPHPRENGSRTPSARRPTRGPRPGKTVRATPAAAQHPCREPAHIPVVRGRAAGAARAVQDPCARDRHLPAVLQNGARRGRVAKRGGEAGRKAGTGDGPRRKGDVQRRGREGLERRALGHDPRPRILSEFLLHTLPGLVAAAPRRNLETEPDVVGRIGEQGVGGFDHPVNRIAPGVEGDDVAGHCESPPGRRPEPRLGDQPGQLFGLQGEVALLSLPALRPAALVPAEGAALRHQQRTAHLRPPGELGILPAIADEGLVEASDLLVQRPRDPEILPGHRAEQVAVPGGQIAGARHVALKPGRVGWPAGEQFAEGTPMRADRRGTDPGNRHTGAEAERQRIADGVMPARMCRDQPGLRDHIAVEEDEDVVGRGGDAGVAGACKPEPAPFLADHLHLERVPAGRASGGSEPSSTTTTSSSPRGQACRSSPATVSASASGASKQGTITLTGSAGANAPGSGSSTCRQSLWRTAAGRGPGVVSCRRRGSFCRTVMLRAGTTLPPAAAQPRSAGPEPPRRAVAPASAAPGGRRGRAAAVPPTPCR